MNITEKSIPHIFRNKYLRDLGSGSVVINGSGGGTVTTITGNFLPANLYGDIYQIEYNTEFLGDLRATSLQIDDSLNVLGNSTLNSLTVNNNTNLGDTLINGYLDIYGDIYVNGEKLELNNSSSNVQSIFDLNDVEDWDYQRDRNDEILMYNTYYNAFKPEPFNIVLDNYMEDLDINTSILNKINESLEEINTTLGDLRDMNSVLGRYAVIDIPEDEPENHPIHVKYKDYVVSNRNTIVEFFIYSCILEYGVEPSHNFIHITLLISPYRNYPPAIVEEHGALGIFLYIGSDMINSSSTGDLYGPDNLYIHLSRGGTYYVYVKDLYNIITSVSLGEGYASNSVNSFKTVTYETDINSLLTDKIVLQNISVNFLKDTCEIELLDTESPYDDYKNNPGFSIGYPRRNWGIFSYNPSDCTVSIGEENNHGNSVGVLRINNVGLTYDNNDGRYEVYHEGNINKVIEPLIASINDLYSRLG